MRAIILPHLGCRVFPGKFSKHVIYVITILETTFGGSAASCTTVSTYGLSVVCCLSMPMKLHVPNRLNVVVKTDRYVQLD